MVEAAVRNVCDMMARAITHIEQEIAAKERRVEVLGERIAKLQAKPDPDLAQIQELEGDIQELEEQLKTDRSQLGAFQEEFAASCGPERENGT